MKVNYKLLPIKAHYFCFMAALGPLLPQMNVFGRQLGVSPAVMGIVTSILPILFMIAKPVVGFLADYFKSLRKFIFLSLIVTMCTSFGLLYFLPATTEELTSLWQNGTVEINASKCPIGICNETNTAGALLQDVSCYYSCPDLKPDNLTNKFNASLYHDQNSFNICVNKTQKCDKPYDCKYVCEQIVHEDYFLYGTPTFWLFVILMSLGTIAFNVTNCISDAICFDILGNGGEMKYGKQRVWGTIGYGITALLSGFAIDKYSEGKPYKDYLPGIIIMMAFTLFDLIGCKKLRLPDLSTPSSITSEVWKLLKQRHIAIFICFATMAGVMDSFIIYYLFWYMEELAEIAGYHQHIKLLEGLTIAAESFGGEVLFFLISGKILSKIGYGHSLTICFFCYALRMGLISFVSNPWWVLPIEFFMQGPTYALCYTTIVAYASAVAPEGASATVQGIVAGMDDGFGFSIGSLIGGFLMKSIGGALSFKVFSIMALCCCIVHCILYFTVLKDRMGTHKSVLQKTLESKEKGQYETPQVALSQKQDHA